MSRFLFAAFVAAFSLFSPFPVDSSPIGMAVEFMDHAACVYIAQEKGWFEGEGLELSAYESYVTGMALAAALARGDIQVAYICLAPAISAYANTRVPLKVVAGTHRYGYGLVVDPRAIKAVRDLEDEEVRIGCVREGGATDLFLRRTLQEFHLKEEVLRKVRRMSPPKQLLAIKMGRLDAAFLPEQWATMAEGLGFRMLLSSQQIWPEMQGSVLVVKEKLLEERPEVVRKLVKVTRKATQWLHQNPDEAARIVARHLQVTAKEVFPRETAGMASRLRITPEVIARSMARMEYTTSLDPQGVQEIIDYMFELGYIRRDFEAEEILDLRYLHGE